MGYVDFINYNRRFFLNFLAKSYDCLLASDSLVRQIPRIAGPQLNKMGKFPSPASHDTPLTEKMDELHRTVR